MKYIIEIGHSLYVKDFEFRAYDEEVIIKLTSDKSEADMYRDDNYLQILKHVISYYFPSELITIEEYIEEEDKDE